jgi:hypothetical protein
MLRPIGRAVPADARHEQRDIVLHAVGKQVATSRSGSSLSSRADRRAAHQIADHQRRVPVGRLDDVIPVAADLGPTDALGSSRLQGHS